MERIKYYANILVICGFTMWFGHSLLAMSPCAVDVLVLFPDNMIDVIGWLMLILPIVKVFSLLTPYGKFKKHTLIIIAILWLTVTWSYFINPMPNNSYILTALITVLCFLELYRGDY